MNIFKRYLLIMAIAAIAVSCKKGEEVAPITLEGTTWLQTEYTYTCADPTFNETETFSCTPTECYKLRLVNGTMTYTEIYNSTTITDSQSYEIDGDKLKITFSEPGFSITVIAIYELVDDMLTLTIEDPDGEPCSEIITFIAE